MLRDECRKRRKEKEVVQAELDKLRMSLESDKNECPACDKLMADVGEAQGKHAERVEQCDKLSADLARVESKLANLHAYELPVFTECENCPLRVVEIAELERKCGGQLEELEKLRAELQEVRVRPILLGSCKVCPTLRAELERATAAVRRLEKLEVPACEFCGDQAELTAEMRFECDKLDDENTHLRELLSWLSTNEPQLRIMIQSFKRGDSVGVSYNYTKPSEAEAARLKEESGSGLSPQEKFLRTFDKPSFQTDQPKDGVINE